MKEKLTKLQALKAMTQFLEIYYEQTKSDDIGSLLGDIDTELFSDSQTADPAAWKDWTGSVNAVLNGQAEERLTKLQAYNSMRSFLEGYRKRTNSDDIRLLLDGMEIISDRNTVDPVAWYYWINSVDKALKEK